MCLTVKSCVLLNSVGEQTAWLLLTFFISLQNELSSILYIPLSHLIDMAV